MQMINFSNQPILSIDCALVLFSFVHTPDSILRISPTTVPLDDAGLELVDL